MRTWLMSVLSILAAAGCVTQRSITDFTPAEVAQNVRVEDSEFQKTPRYVGMNISQSYGLGDRAIFFLRSWPQPSGEPPQHQLYVSRFYMGASWIFYDRATDDHADDHRVTRISSDVGACSVSLGSSSCLYVEEFGVDLDDSFMRARRSSGFRLQVSARNGAGAVVLNVPANYIDGHLSALGQ